MCLVNIDLLESSKVVIIILWKPLSCIVFARTVGSSIILVGARSLEPAFWMWKFPPQVLKKVFHMDIFYFFVVLSNTWPPSLFVLSFMKFFLIRLISVFPWATIRSNHCLLRRPIVGWSLLLPLGPFTEGRSTAPSFCYGVWSPMGFLS